VIEVRVLAQVSHSGGDDIGGRASPVPNLHQAFSLWVTGNLLYGRRERVCLDLDRIAMVTAVGSPLAEPGFTDRVLRDVVVEA
jgi:hypothetical protein